MPFKNIRDKNLTGLPVCSLALELFPQPTCRYSLWKRKPMLDVCSLLWFLSLEMDLTTLKISESFRGGRKKSLCACSALVCSSLSSDFSPSHLLMSTGLGTGCINSALSQQEIAVAILGSMGAPCLPWTQHSEVFYSASSLIWKEAVEHSDHHRSPTFTAGHEFPSVQWYL